MQTSDITDLYPAAIQKFIRRSYESVEGVNNDVCEAFKWYHKAAEQGDASAQYLVGKAYLPGLDVNMLALVIPHTCNG